MEVMTVFGGPREDGFSGRMLEEFTDDVRRLFADGRSEGSELAFRRYSAYRCGFLPCDDCRACCAFEGCVHSDMDEFFVSFESCDAVVIATPVYNSSYPAPMKAVIDRLQRYFNARFSLGINPPIAKRRRLVALLSCAERADADCLIRSLKRTLTVVNCSFEGAVVFSGADSCCAERFPDENIREEIYKLAKKITI